MSILKKIFKSSKTTQEVTPSNVQWIPLTSVEQLTEVKALSKSEAVIIFKHSTRCGTSRIALKQFEKSFDEEMKTLKVYYLDLLNYREVSNEVGYAFQVLHQSPQLLVIKNEVAVEHASHYEIMSVDLKKHPAFTH